MLRGRLERPSELQKCITDSDVYFALQSSRHGSAAGVLGHYPPCASTLPRKTWYQPLLRSHWALRSRVVVVSQESRRRRLTLWTLRNLTKPLQSYLSRTLELEPTRCAIDSDEYSVLLCSLFSSATRRPPFSREPRGTGGRCGDWRSSRRPRRRPQRTSRSARITMSVFDQR